jgi:hypothetical protein
MRESFTALIPASDARWNSVLAGVEHDFYALPSYAEFCARRSAGRAVAFVFQDPELRLLVPLLLLPLGAAAGAACHASCPYGYPGIAIDRGPPRPAALARALQALRASLRAQGVASAFLSLHPMFELPLSALEQAGTLVAHGQTVSVDLAADLEHSWAELRPTHRRHIQAACRAGFTAQLGWERLDEYQECYRQTMQRVGAAEQYVLGRDYVEGLRGALGGHLQLWSVLQGGRVACAGLFSELNGIVQYHLGGTRDEFLAASPMKLLFDAVRRWGHERGNRVLHLGGGLGGQADALFHFKAGFSGRRHKFHTLRLIADPALFAERCRAAGVPERADGRFPPFAAPARL